jgi:hypothetical protein
LEVFAIGLGVDSAEYTAVLPVYSTGAGDSEASTPEGGGDVSWHTCPNLVNRRERVFALGLGVNSVVYAIVLTVYNPTVRDSEASTPAGAGM